MLASPFESARHREMKAYFKTEYRGEAEWAYYNWLESTINKTKKKSLLARFFRYWFPTEQQLMENYLSQATDLVDLEQRQKIWEERSRKYKDPGALY